MIPVRRALLIALLAVLACAGGRTTADAAGTGTALPLHTFGVMVVDDAHGHVFVTGSRTLDSSVVMLDTAGAIVDMITDVPGAAGMVVHNSTLYVAQCGLGTIKTFDTATLAPTGSFSVTIGDQCSIAFAGDRLWYINTDQNADLYSVTVDSSHTEVVHPGSWYGATFATTPAMPDRLVVSGPGTQPSDINVFDVSGGGFTSVATSSVPAMVQMALSPDGTQLYTASGAPYAIERWALPGFTAAGSFATVDHPYGVAVSEDGSLVAAAVNGWDDEEDITVFPTAGGSAKLHVEFGPWNEIYGRGLAFDSANRLYAVENHNGGPYLHVYYPAAPPVSISVTASASTITVGGRTNLTVHLGGWGAGKPVKLYATPYGGTKTLVASGVANAFGNYVRAVAPARRTTYTAEWEGDAAHAPDTATKLIYVRARVAIAQAGFYGSSGSYRLYHFHSSCWTAGTYCPRFAATVYPNHAGAAVRFVLQRRTSSGAWANATSGSATADSRSIAHAFFRYGGTGWIGQTLRVRASWAGNVQNLAAASGWSYFRITR